MRKSQVLDSRASQGLWSEPVGPFVFGFEAVQEGLQSKFLSNASCAIYRRSWTMEQVKEHKSVTERDNATPVRKNQLQQNKKACETKPEDPTQPIYEMNIIVKGFLVGLDDMVGLAIVGWV
jgi:hypothetical protein